MTLSQLDHAPLDLAQPPSIQTPRAPLARQPVGAGPAPAGVHYVVCTSDADRDTLHGADFLAAVARARHLVKIGARRVVFLIAGNASDTALHRSLKQFASHAGRTMPSRPIDFVVIPLTGAGLHH